MQATNIDLIKLGGALLVAAAGVIALVRCTPSQEAAYAKATDTRERLCAIAAALPDSVPHVGQARQACEATAPVEKIERVVRRCIDAATEP